MKQGMTKSEAIMSIATLTSGTIAMIVGSSKYSVIDDFINRMIIKADSMSEDAFEECSNWQEVLITINATLDGAERPNWYLVAMRDFREYMIKYGLERSNEILESYIKTIKLEGIEDRKSEQEYIRGAKDALCIA